MCWRVCVSSDPGRDHMAEHLTAALEQLGLSCRVEARDGLAIMYPVSAADVRLADDDVRRQIVTLGRERGFTHVAIALGVGGG